MQVEFLYPCKTSRASSSRSAAKWFTSAQPYFKGLTGFKTTACTCPLILKFPFMNNDVVFVGFAIGVPFS